MPEINRHATRAGRKFQRDITKYLREKGYDAEDLALAGSEDEGDVSLRVANALNGHKITFVIEAKRTRAFTPADWIKQAKVEAANYAKHRKWHTATHPVVVSHARGKGIGRAYVIQELDDWLSQVSGS